MARGQHSFLARNNSFRENFNLHCSSNPTGAMGDRAHFSRPYMESGYDDDEGGKRKEKKIRMMSSGSRPLQNAAGRAQMSGVICSRRVAHFQLWRRQQAHIVLLF